MRSRWWGIVDAAALCLVPAAAFSQQVDPSDKDATVELVIDQPLSSRTSRIGEPFRLRLARPVLDSAGHTLVPAGTAGEGEIIHAAKAGGAGRAGELIVAARFLQCDRLRIRLGHTHLIARGRDGSAPVGAVNAAAAGAAALTPLAGAGALIAFAIKGGEVVLPTGTPATARITDLAEMSGAATACAAGPEHVQQGEGL